MFETQHFESNESLIEECSKLVAKHNELSYQKVKLRLPTIEYKDISKTKPRAEVANDVARFYQVYTAQTIITKELQTLIDSMTYTTDDLGIHIDLSTDSIITILAGLTEVRDRLTEYQQRISNNCDAAVSDLIQSMKEKSLDESSISELIDVTFNCMIHRGSGEYLFIPVGAEILSTVQSQFSEQQIQLVKASNNDVKQMLLQSKSLKQLPFNRLQRFGLLPDEGCNCDFARIIKNLLALDIPSDIPFQKSLEPLTKNLKLLSAESGISTGLIIVVSQNDDSYFDMSSLLAVSRAQGSAGISETMIITYDLIKEGDKSKMKSDDMITINVTESTQQAYLLWTNDLKSFKSRAAPINNIFIQKLLRRAPSPIIEAHNNLLEHIIKDARTEDAISFNRVKYMSFSNDATEESYLEYLCSALVKNISSSIGKLTGDKLKDVVADDSFTKMILTTINNAKPKLGVLPQMLPSHSHIIYASMAYAIAKKIKKSLITLDTATKQFINDTVEINVKTNDNLYSRVVASYYLHMA